METKNATIDDAEIFIEDHGILTCFLYLRYGDNSCQGFGGRRMYSRSGCDRGGWWIWRTLETVGVSNWDQLKGKNIRVTLDSPCGTIIKIGNIIEDKWFHPSEELEHKE